MFPDFHTSDDNGARSNPTTVLNYNIVPALRHLLRLRLLKLTTLEQVSPC